MTNLPISSRSTCQIYTPCVTQSICSLSAFIYCTNPCDSTGVERLVKRERNADRRPTVIKGEGGKTESEASCDEKPLWCFNTTWDEKKYRWKVRKIAANMIDDKSQMVFFFTSLKNYTINVTSSEFQTYCSWKTSIISTHSPISINSSQDRSQHTFGQVDKWKCWQTEAARIHLKCVIFASIQSSEVNVNTGKFFWIIQCMIHQLSDQVSAERKLHESIKNRLTVTDFGSWEDDTWCLMSNWTVVLNRREGLRLYFDPATMQYWAHLAVETNRKACWVTLHKKP